MEDWVQPTSRGELPRREVMQTPDEVAAMLRLKASGWVLTKRTQILLLIAHANKSL